MFEDSAGPRTLFWSRVMSDRWEMTTIADHDHLLLALISAAEQHPDAAMAAFRRGSTFVDVTSASLWDDVRAIGQGLIAAHVTAGDRVALMGKTSYEWLVVDCAINAVGAVTVPIYETSSAAQIEWILQDSAAVLAVVATAELAATASPITHALATCNNELVVIEDGGLEALKAMGASIGPGELNRRLDAISVHDTATIIYTSGTTGRPKGCVLTHHNLRSNVRQIADALAGTVDSSDTALLFLPLAHVLTKITALYCLEHRIKIAFATSIDRLAEELAMVQPSLISAVPRIFEKVYASAQHRAEAGHKGFVFERAAEIAIRASREREAGQEKLRTRLEHQLYDRLVYSKLRASFGGALRMAFSGGGPLGERLTSFFDGTGLRIYEGYGLTETSPILTLSRSDRWSPGSVGLPVRDTSLRLADDGEILAKGPQVFAEYWHNPRATAEAFDDDGWFLTGDIGSFDDDGCLHIVGRSKELIVTAAGKNVAPAPLEDLLRAHSLISQAMVVGDGRPFIAALITLDEEAIAEWRSHHDADELRAEIQQAVDDANSTVSRAESIRTFTILPHDFDLASEELTPTLKVRRAVVMKHYAAQIEEMYAG